MQEIFIDKAPTDDEKTIKTIAMWTTALMNTSGGLIVLYSNNPDSDKKRDHWIMGFESVLINNWIPESTFQSHVRFQYLEMGDQFRIYMFVCKVPHVITFTYNAYGRRAAGITPIRDGSRIEEMLTETRHIPEEDNYASALKHLTKDHPFYFNDPIPTGHRENQIIEFKHCYYTGASGKTDLIFFDAKELNRRLRGYFEYFSAFANTHGGSLVLGVEEGGKIPVIRGFQVVENQKKEEQRIINYLSQELSMCIWHADPDYQPCMGNDWDICFHDVIQDGNPNRKIIEILIPKHVGGMLLRSPIYYKVSDNGKNLVWNIKHDEETNAKQKKSFEDWKMHFHTGTTSSLTNDNQDYFRQHIESEVKQKQVSGDAVPDDGAGVYSDESAVNSSTETQDHTDESVENKLPKSFKDSESEYKTDISVNGLNLKDCCSLKMAKHMQNLSHTKAWYPAVEILRKLYPAYLDGVFKFINGREWSGVASVMDNAVMGMTTESEERTLHIDDYVLVCRVLIARTSESPTLVYCMKNTSTNNIRKEATSRVVEYALQDARKLKKEFLLLTINSSHQFQLFHFDVEVLILSREGDVHTLWDSTWKTSQPVEYPAVDSKVQYSIACNGLAERLLKTRADVKDRYGEILIEHLTEAQARILFETKERVLIVSGKSGTGKTVIALHLVHEALGRGCTGQDVLYICSGVGLREFITSQVHCHAVVVEKTDCLSQEVHRCLQKAKLVIVDDVHAIALGDNWKDDTLDLYKILFTCASKGTCEVAIFFDNEQDYKNRLPFEFDKRLRGVAEATEGMLPEHIKIVTLTERIRNSQEINRFMQANQNQANIPGTISCLNELRGDDILYEYIGDNVVETANIIHAKLHALKKKYSPRSIAILCDDSDQLQTTKALLKETFHRKFQDGKTYPITHTVMCKLDDFMGLEADAILFLLPKVFVRDKTMVNWKYINFVSSRARVRLELLLLWEPSLLLRSEVQKLTNLLDLFKTVSIYTVSID